ncbi:MAG: chromate efflux transporter [Actinomycetota bacterium]
MGEPSPPTTEHPVGFGEAARFWIKLGFINFGGPAGQISIMHAEIVERRRWIGEGRFLHALNYCMLLPGPEAQQLAIYIGWLLHRVRGGLVAGIAFVLPSFFLLLGLSWVYAAHGSVDWVAGIFSGLAAAVIAIVVVATIRIGSRALANPLMAGVAVASFVAIFVLHLPFPGIVLVAAGLGLLGDHLRPDWFEVGVERELEEHEQAAIRDDAAAGEHTRPTVRHTVLVLVIGLAAWLLPLLLVAWWRGSGDVLTEQGWFFSRAALVTFGGAYAVLAYINQAAVVQYGWLLPGQMVVGLGLAESTPGPLIMVVEFVGFVGAYQNPGELEPIVAGILGASVAVWATFAPCFLWIFLGAPYIERLRGNRRLGAALQTVTAAVVGVIASLAITFAITTLFSRVRLVGMVRGPIPVPVLSSVVWFAVVVALGGFVAMRWFKVGVVPIVLASAVAGLVWNGLL